MRNELLNRWASPLSGFFMRHACPSPFFPAFQLLLLDACCKLLGMQPVSACPILRRGMNGGNVPSRFTPHWRSCHDDIITRRIKRIVQVVILSSAVRRDRRRCTPRHKRHSHGGSERTARSRRASCAVAFKSERRRPSARTQQRSPRSRSRPRQSWAIQSRRS